MKCAKKDNVFVRYSRVPSMFVFMCMHYVCATSVIARSRNIKIRPTGFKGRFQITFEQTVTFESEKSDILSFQLIFNSLIICFILKFLF